MHEVHFFLPPMVELWYCTFFSKSTGTAKVSRYILNGVPSTGIELLLGASTEYRYRLTFKVPMHTFGFYNSIVGTLISYFITRYFSKTLRTTISYKTTSFVTLVSFRNNSILIFTSFLVIRSLYRNRLYVDKRNMLALMRATISFQFCFFHVLA